MPTQDESSPRSGGLFGRLSRLGVLVLAVVILTVAGALFAQSACK